MRFRAALPRKKEMGTQTAFRAGRPPPDRFERIIARVEACSIGPAHSGVNGEDAMLSAMPLSRGPSREILAVEAPTEDVMEPINVVIPIGGVGSRFAKEGYRFPKVGGDTRALGSRRSLSSTSLDGPCSSG